jgi:cell fate (sporulation/competence/biofilm development) regulator YlbF (YheA/YmcA/DUF963 family)
MNNLDQKIGEFSLAIKETKEYLAYKQAAQIYDADRASQILLNDLQMAQQAVDIFEQGNFSGLDEQKKKYEDLLEKVRKNEAINEWVKTRKQMEILVGELATAISNDIGFPFNLPPKKGCGCSG